MRHVAAVGRQRGSVLLVTVLLLLVASGVAYTVVRGALSVESAEADRSQVLQQVREAASAHRRAQSDLTADPLLLLRQVLEGEADRYCSVTGTTFAAGEAWPTECGLTWSYREEDRSGGMLIAGPDGDDRDLRMLTLLETGQGTISLQSRYRIGAIRPFLHADGDLDLTGLAWLTPSGLITAGGDLTLGGQDGDGAWGAFAGGSIGGSTPTADATPTRQLTGSDAETVAGRTLSGGLQATRAQVRQQACQSLCLEAGGTVVDSSGTALLLPADTASVRIGLHGTQAQLHVSAQRLDADSLSGAAFAVPGGDTDFWGTAIGTVDLPEAGLIGTDLDVVLAPCLEGQTDCGQYQRSFTLLAGSPGRPAVLALSGEITAAADARAGVSVLGEIIRAPWNPGLDSGSSMTLSVSVLGGQEQAFGLYGAVPANENAWENHTTSLQGTFAFTGTPDLSAAGLQLTYDEEAAEGPPPWWPGVDLEPVRRQTRLLDPAETTAALAALPAGPTATGAVPGAPVLQTVTGSTGQLTVQFQPPEWEGSSAISSYQYSLDDGASWNDRQTGSTGSPLTITGLTAGATYSVRIRAINDAGAGLRSNMLPGRAGLGVDAPGIPTGLTAQPAGYLLTAGDDGTNGAILLEWTDGGDANSWRIQHRQQGGSTWTESGTSSQNQFLLDGIDGANTWEVRVVAVNAAGDSDPSAPVTAPAVIGTGGTVTVFVADGTNGPAGERYVVHTFTDVGPSTFTLNATRDLEYLLVGGGGSAGNSGARAGGSGGGGGGVLSGNLEAATGSYLLQVGAGGVWDGTAGSGTGDDTSAFSLTAAGGGQGGPIAPPANLSYGLPGGSGGGGGGITQVGAPNLGGAGTAGQGYEGGDSGPNNTADRRSGGGGGGAAEPGGDGGDNIGGDGGDGRLSYISGTGQRYGGGGGGGYVALGAGSPGAGGSGGGGAASVSPGNGQDGVDGLGGGGAGETADGVNNIYQPGTGGDGVVIIRYPITEPPNFTPITATGGDSVTELEIGGVTYRLHVFTSTGTSTFTVTGLGDGGSVDYLIVGGGGGGGGGDDVSSSGGGGGAGGYQQGSTTVAATSYSIVVGDGGAGVASGSRAQGADGQASTAFSVTAAGGGGGGGVGTQNGRAGGSGGGAARAGTAGPGTSGQGSSGGSTTSASGGTGGGHGGGGGGAAGGGQTGEVGAGGGGGAGVDLSALFGTSFGDSGVFAGGGAGGEAGSRTPQGGGGGGGDAVLNGGGDGQDGTGGGGSGAAEFNSGNGSGPAAGSGGSGVVIIRYPITSP